MEPPPLGGEFVAMAEARLVGRDMDDPPVEVYDR